MNALIAVNELVEWAGNQGESFTERILWTDEGNTIAYVLGIATLNGFPKIRTIKEITEAIESDAAKKVDDDPTIRLIEDADINVRDKAIRDRAWAIISSLVTHDNEPAIYRRETRGPLVKMAIKDFKVTEKTVYRYLRRYWQRGQMKNALLPDYNKSGGAGKSKTAGGKKRGRPRRFAQALGTGINVDEETRKIFRISIKRYYLTDKENSLKETYDQMIKDFYSEGIKHENGVEKPILKPAGQIPSLAQFRYWHEKENDVRKMTIARKGAKKYELEYRPVLGSSTGNMVGPGSVFQIDATVGDVYLVSRYNRKWIIGRPVIYVMIDVFSRMIAGIYVGLEGPSWIGAMMALANAAADKVKFCKEYEIDITDDMWPCHHMPNTIVADRGEMMANNADVLVDSLNVEIQYAPPYRADWKGIVEQNFNVIQTQVKPFLPGFVDKDFRERGVRDYRTDAVLDIYQFTQLIIKCVLHHNLKHFLVSYLRDDMLIADEVTPIPIELWEWGITNRSGALRFYPEDYVKLSLMPRSKARVSYKGILFKKLSYSCDRAIRELWFDRARNKSWQIDVSYDPRNMNSIYIRNVDDQGQFEKCFLLDQHGRYYGKTMDEIEYLFKVEKRGEQAPTHADLQSKADLTADIQNIVKKAEKMTSDAYDGTVSDTARVNGTRVHRKKEKELNRETEAFDIGDRKTTVGNRATKKRSGQKEVVNPDLLDVLKKKQEERALKDE
jgi:hypothetical protein